MHTLFAHVVWMGDMNWKLEAGVQPEFAIDRIRAGALEELEGLDTLTQVRSSRRVPCRTVASSAQSFPVSARASWVGFASDSNACMAFEWLR